MKKAMTLAEIIIVFVIIGIISVLGLVTTNSSSKKVNKYMYTRAFNTLNTAIYNIYAKEDASAFDNTNNLCYKLTKYINSTQVDTNYQKREELYCNKDQTVGVDFKTDFKSKTPNFTMSNGMEVYLTPRQTIENYEDSYGNKSNLNFYIAFVDLNGKDRGFNTADYDSQKENDIVAFVLTTAGNAIPFGPPYYDKNYLTAKVIYNDPNTRDEAYLPEVYSYYEAICVAWNHRSSFDDYRTIDFNYELKQDSKKPTTTLPVNDNCKEDPNNAANENASFDCDIEITNVR